MPGTSPELTPEGRVVTSMDSEVYDRIQRMREIVMVSPSDDEESRVYALELLQPTHLVDIAVNEFLDGLMAHILGLPRDNLND